MALGTSPAVSASTEMLWVRLLQSEDMTRPYQAIRRQSRYQPGAAGVP